MSRDPHGPPSLGICSNRVVCRNRCTLEARDAEPGPLRRPDDLGVERAVTEAAHGARLDVHIV